MKNKVILSAAVLVCVLSAAIFMWPQGMKNPPVMSVEIGGESFEIKGSAISWRYRRFVERAYEEALTHPLEAGIMDIFDMTGLRVGIGFEEKPDSYEVLCWNMADMDLNGQVEVPITDDGFAPMEGDWVYEVIARWDWNGRFGGDARYLFRVAR